MASTCIANQGGWSELANSYSTTSICMNLLDSGNQGYSIFQTHDDISATGMQTGHLSLSCILVRIKWMCYEHARVSAAFEQVYEYTLSTKDRSLGSRIVQTQIAHSPFILNHDVYLSKWQSMYSSPNAEGASFAALHTTMLILKA